MNGQPEFYTANLTGYPMPIGDGLGERSINCKVDIEMKTGAVGQN
jgi:hypothetical protein